ncbi:MAG TPA: hypothetical protein VHX59_07855 [Mycobacteriales bacterium]|nr:hypothetical protein [Mycobacteriales bacterium]
MQTNRINRAQFLAGVAAAGITGAAGSLLTAGTAGATTPRRRGLTYRGVGYEVADGGTSQTSWRADRMRTDLWTIKELLHASSVSVFGDGVDRLTATASEAAERGLHIYLQPRLGDRPERDTLEHLAEIGKYAERLRRQGAKVHLSVGCEFVLFVPGIVPGADALERIKNLLAGTYDHKLMQRKLSAFIARAATVGRSVFHGKLTYGAASDDVIDWTLFDIVSIDYYSYFARRGAYVRDLRQYQRWGKPLAIAEYGTCTYKGAPQRGGMGWDVVDYTKDPEQIIDGLVRSERDQAIYLTEVLGVFEEMGLYSATVYEFVSPDAPHRNTPRYDLDMACYGLVKAIWETPDRPGAGWHWQPKESFFALADAYRRAARPSR